MDILFRGQTGFYVDVGAKCGRVISNTAQLEQAGWAGICVEPHPESFRKLTQNRPQAQCFNVAVSDQDGGTAEFIAIETGPVGRSGLRDTYRAQDIGRITRRDHQLLQVPLRSLTSLLDEAQAPDLIQYLDVDVEGHELQVLKGTDFSRYRFGVIGVETRPGFAGFEEIVAYLDEVGYAPVIQLGADTMFMAKTAPTRP